MKRDLHSKLFISLNVSIFFSKSSSQAETNMLKLYFILSYQDFIELYVPVLIKAIVFTIIIVITSLVSTTTIDTEKRNYFNNTQEEPTTNNRPT